MSRAKPNQPEPAHCVQYHEYMETLSNMKYDKTIPAHHRVGASWLRTAIGVHHMKNCVPESYNSYESYEKNES